jgi:hypothetical protein
VLSHGVATSGSLSNSQRLSYEFCGKGLWLSVLVDSYSLMRITGIGRARVAVSIVHKSPLRPGTTQD